MSWCVWLGLQLLFCCVVKSPAISVDSMFFVVSGQVLVEVLSRVSRETTLVRWLSRWAGAQGGALELAELLVPFLGCFCCDLAQASAISTAEG